MTQVVEIAGVGRVEDVLSAVRPLFQDLEDVKPLCRNIHGRLERLWERIRGDDARGRTHAFVMTLRAFQASVRRQYAKSAVVQIVTGVWFLRQLDQCHEEILEMCRDDEGLDMNEWMEDWERHRQTIEHAFMRRVANKDMLRGELVDEDSTEILGLTLYQQRKYGKEAAYLDKLRDLLLQDPTVNASVKLPSWFLSTDDVAFHPDPFVCPESGSLGTVHHGTWNESTSVIVKCIELVVPTADRVKKDWKEVDVWSTLQHPNILRLYGACHVSRPAWIACEEAAHGNIREYLDNDSTRRSRLWRLFHDAAIGLTFLHERNIIHGNLKCSNILVGDDGRAKLADFGMSDLQQAIERRSWLDGETRQWRERRSSISAYPTSSWQAPELLEAAKRGEEIVTSFASDIFAFAVCILEILSLEQRWGKNEQFLAKCLNTVRRPQNISDEEWYLIKDMCSPDPSQRLSIQRVKRRMYLLAEAEARRDFQVHQTPGEEDDIPPSEDVDKHRKEHEMQRAAQRLQRELEDLRRKVREQERALELALERRRQAEGGEKTRRKDSVEPKSTRTRRGDVISVSMTTKKLLRYLRWGTPEEQSDALDVLVDNPRVHDAVNVARHNGLEVLIAIIKHGHSSEFRITALDLLQRITTVSNGIYLNAVLEHGVTQILMSVLHYRLVPVEQRRAAQFLLVLSVKSARARSFFVQNSGVELMLKVLYESHQILIDEQFRATCDHALMEEIHKFLASQAESRAREADKALENRQANRELAAQKYTEAIFLDHRNGRYFARRSEVYSLLCKYEYASRDALQCIKRLPDYGEGYFRHAMALYGARDVEQAEKALRLGRQRDPHYFTRDRLQQLTFHVPQQAKPRQETKKRSEAGSVTL
ncbi:hypothetical protein Poli38472_007994 [Pythium oligandrum]|uniref:Protein kinase domain-containing protein n=1 Tax=Pythium oligandrum TaxID=41045 RepID=A0A8K1CN04_PYTOL|nr:hypothetical protein Poli38472_007994 [Pythium oligandrum]|eukprot:TMW65352.1 hypothetical protein Poli38472_007994 [Pythium oligandrum]